MSADMACQPTVIRIDRGLSIAGTRITLYAIMDYVTAGWPPKLIRDRFNLTDQQIADVMTYIAQHRVEVEDRSFKHHFSTESSGSQPLKTPLAHASASVGSRLSLAALAAPPARRGRPPQRCVARRGMEMRSLDRRRRMGDGRVSGVSPRQGLGTAGLRKPGGPPVASPATGEFPPWSKSYFNLYSVLLA
jgi:hypothetical protein